MMIPLKAIRTIPLACHSRASQIRSIVHVSNTSQVTDCRFRLVSGTCAARKGAKARDVVRAKSLPHVTWQCPSCRAPGTINRRSCELHKPSVQYVFHCAASGRSGTHDNFFNHHAIGSCIPCSGRHGEVTRVQPLVGARLRSWVLLDQKQRMYSPLSRCTSCSF